jgi:hypothetical protein
VPPVASDGPPVGLIRTTPSGEATRLRLPLKSTAADVRAARSRTYRTRSASTSPVGTPASRENSPACGVRIRSALRSARSSGRPANAFRPSASRTTGTSLERTSSRIQPCVRSSVVIPGPSASAPAWASTSSRRAEPPAAVPASVSGSSTNTASRSAPWTTGSTASATATATSPAPARYAAVPASVGAPVIRREPPTTTANPAARLCVSGARCGSIAATSPASTSSRSPRIRSGGNPIGSTSITPADVAPGSNTSPGLGAPNVTVRSACAAAPATAPVAPSTPEGMSTATTGTEEAFSAAIASACMPSGTPRNPVPKIASTATSERASSRSIASAENGRRRTLVSWSLRRLDAAGSRSPSSSVRTVVRTPERSR